MTHPSNDKCLKIKTIKIGIWLAVFIYLTVDNIRYSLV